MAITTGAALFEFGTQATVIVDAATASGAFSAAADATTLTQTDYCPLGDAVLDITFTSAPTAGDAVHLYRRDLNIDSTNDAVEPDASYKNLLVGSFLLDPSATRQYHSLTDIPLTIEQDFYIELDTASVATATNSTTVKVTPKTYNVK